MKRTRLALFTGALLLSSTLAWAAPVDVNTATASELAQIDGLNDELASNIVRERDENGPFKSIDDLKRVPGISDANIRRAKAQLAFGSAGGSSAPRNGGNAEMDAEVRRILKKFDGEPTIRQTQEAAIDYMRANPGLIDSWRVRSRLRGAAPIVRGTAGYDVDRDYNWPNNTAPESPFLPPYTQSRRDTFNNNVGVQAQATWNLDRLIFDPEEPRVNREAVRLSKHMDQVLDDVTRRYFERRRLQVELELNPPTDVGDRLRKEIRLQELTADIDGMTGGYFSSQVKKKAGR